MSRDLVQCDKVDSCGGCVACHHSSPHIEARGCSSPCVLPTSFDITADDVVDVHCVKVETSMMSGV